MELGWALFPRARGKPEEAFFIDPEELDDWEWIEGVAMRVGGSECTSPLPRTGPARGLVIWVLLLDIMEAGLDKVATLLCLFLKDATSIAFWSKGSGMAGERG